MNINEYENSDIKQRMIKVKQKISLSKEQEDAIMEYCEYVMKLPNLPEVADELLNSIKRGKLL